MVYTLTNQDLCNALHVYLIGSCNTWVTNQWERCNKPITPPAGASLGTPWRPAGYPPAPICITAFANHYFPKNLVKGVKLELANLAFGHSPTTPRYNAEASPSSTSTTAPGHPPEHRPTVPATTSAPPTGTHGLIRSAVHSEATWGRGLDRIGSDRSDRIRSDRRGSERREEVAPEGAEWVTGFHSQTTANWIQTAFEGQLMKNGDIALSGVHDVAFFASP
ncbi:hypothetical protein BDK51DRAFT_41103 [Blyttiomyces helicus]|uniref:Uncharacterized protein n=1 Tax=Blyttiomyces helicus TaxID=388810 RepID=A0A4P9WJH5_9FUNG|nr:hypothetical protein BDK51DRAFT_41103 [Blyttiomyces helicus]|eukprot:RKO92205.1 hypothetical protein BDK51DRAFT_41103 [Blyttiomyces helicus]